MALALARDPTLIKTGRVEEPGVDVERSDADTCLLVPRRSIPQ
jgi:hypothetical protein